MLIILCQGEPGLTGACSSQHEFLAVSNEASLTGKKRHCRPFPDSARLFVNSGFLPQDPVLSHRQQSRQVAAGAAAVLVSRTEHLSVAEERASESTDQVTTLASGLAPGAKCKLPPMRLAFRPRSFSLTFIMTDNTSEYLLVPRHFVGLGDSSIKRRHSFCPGGFTVPLGCPRVHVNEETKQSRQGSNPSSHDPFIPLSYHGRQSNSATSLLMLSKVVH